jgi:DNA replication protein DnaD
MNIDKKISSSTTLETLGGLWLKDTLVRIEHKLDKLIMNVADAIQVLADENVKLDDIGARLTEGFAEITALIGQLQNTTLSPEQEQIVNDLKAKVDAVQPQAQQIADIVPNP